MKTEALPRGVSVKDGSYYFRSGNFRCLLGHNLADALDRYVDLHSRAYGLMDVKSVNDERRELSGLATSIAADRMGDVVVPAGASFKLPIPLLAQHDTEKPIGVVTEAETTPKGIRIKASIPKDTGLDYVENAWKQIKAGLVRGLSIGFRSLKHEPLDVENPWDGFKFLEWEWLELSAVTIPANAQAMIQTVKMFDGTAPAATGQKRGPVILVPGASGNPTVAKRGGVPLISRGKLT